MAELRTPKERKDEPPLPGPLLRLRPEEREKRCILEGTFLGSRLRFASDFSEVFALHVWDLGVAVTLRQTT